MRVTLVLSALLASANADNYFSGKCDVCWPGNDASQCGGDPATGGQRGCGFANWGCEYECYRAGQTTNYWTGECSLCNIWTRQSQCSGATYGYTGGERGCGFLNAGCEYECRRNCPNVVCPVGQSRQGWCGGRWNNYWCQAIPNYVSQTSSDAEPPPREVWDAIGAPVPAAVASIVGDPHLNLPHGARADFRGEDKAIFNFLSAKDLTLNVMTQDANFELHDEGHPRHKHVHGSFLTQAHIVARTNTGKMVRVSYWADMIGPTNVGFLNGTVDDEPVFKLGPKTAKAVDDVSLKMDYSSLHFETPTFEIVVTPLNLREEAWGRALERNVDGLHHRLDISINLRVPEESLAVAPHGIIGQGWDGDAKAVDGEVDNFPTAGEFTTTAMAKGAIEGAPSDYKVATKYATDFKFSRFDATSAAPRDVASLVAAGTLNAPKAVDAPNAVVGSTEYKFMEL